MGKKISTAVAVALIGGLVAVLGSFSSASEDRLMSRRSLIRLQMRVFVDKYKVPHPPTRHCSRCGVEYELDNCGLYPQYYKEGDKKGELWYIMESYYECPNGHEQIPLAYRTDTNQWVSDKPKELP